MTVSTTVSRWQYNTNGTTGPWTVGALFLADEDLRVTHTDADGVDTLLTLTVDYTVSGAGVQSGGTVTTTDAYASGGLITIVNDPDALQETDYSETDAFPAATHERALDRLTLIVQRLRGMLLRAIRVGDSDDEVEVVSPADRALKTLTCDANGVPSWTSPAAGTASALAADLLDSSSANNGGGMVGYELGTDYSGTPGDPTNIAQAVQEMLGATVFTRYVATTGSDANDGSSGSPFATLQKAFDTLMAIGTVGGTRKISIAAGTYSTSANRTARLGQANASETVPNTNYQADGVTLNNFVIVEGPDVGYNPASAPEPTPTAIFDGGGVAATGIQIEGAKVLFKNLKFINYDASSSSHGIQAERSWIRCENVHADGCYWGVGSYHGSLEVRGGAYENCTGAAWRSIFLNKHSIGNQAAGAAGQGPFARNCAVGLYAQEGATGHSDYASYDGCTRGIRATVFSRANANGSDFKNCDIAIHAEANAVILRPGVTFNDGTADANGENVVLNTGAIDLTRDDDGIGGLATDFLDGDYLITNNTGSITLISKTLARGDYATALTAARHSQIIKFHAFGSRTGSAGTVKIKLRLGSTILAENTIPTGGGYDCEWTSNGSIVFLDSNVQVANLTTALHLKESLVHCDTGTEDMAAADTTLTFEVQCSSLADSVRIWHAHFEVWG